MSEPLKVLLIEDSEDDALFVLRALRQGDFDVAWERVETADALCTALTRFHWDVLISDYRLPKFDAAAALKLVQQQQADLPFIVVSGTIGETLAVELMKAGAHDYLMKNSLTRLPEAVRREVREAQMRTERHQAALELDQTKERLQLAIEGSGIGLWDWSIQTGVVTLNDRWAEIIGYTLQELKPISIKTWHHYTHPEDLQKATVALEQHFRHETQVYECEMRMRHQSGAWIWVLARGKVVERDERGHPVRMTGTHLDITSRKEAVELLVKLNQSLEDRVEERTAALQASETRLREAQQVAHLGSWELEVPTGQLLWSPEVFRIFGLRPDDTEPTYEQLLEHYFPPDERARYAQLVDRAIQQGEAYATDLQIIRADGSSGYVFARAEPLRSAAVPVSRLFGIVMDISDRKTMQEALQRSEERTRATLMALPDLVFRVDRKGRYVDFLVSPPHQNLIDSHQTIGKRFDELLPPELAATQYAALEQAMTTQTVQSYEQQVWLDGKLHYEEVRVAPCGNDEVVFFVRDISDRKQAELQLQQTNEELIRATRLKDEFLANMSHELRTPLTSILGMSEVLKEEVFGVLNAKQHQYIEIVFNSGKHLLQLINDILDVSKISAGKLELEVTTVSVSNLCDSSLVFVKQEAFKKSIQLTTIVAPELGTIDIDERRIRQVLINLLNNAVKFTPESGHVTLEVKRHETLPSDAWIMFSISDTGIGIAPDDQVRLFQPFVHIESSLNRKYEGTGLGLALVKQIVELHGGFVGLTSELGQGSCFTICLPYKRVTTDNTLPHLPQQAGLAQCSTPATALTAQMTDDRPLILLAEDNQSNIDTLAAYLETKGYRLLLAKDGQTAVDMATLHQPDLILMDIQMPRMDGLEAMRQIRLKPALRRLPIIALTALAMAGDRERCLEAGANGYLVKPAKLSQVVALIQQLLDAKNHQ